MTKQHIHKYKRILLGKKDYYVYKCMLEGCNHFIQLALAVSRLSICWGCGGTTVLTPKDIEVRTLHPICESCKEYKRKKKLVVVGDIEEYEGEEYEE